MSELKTLKDLEYFQHLEHINETIKVVESIDLRQEVINWIKAIKEVQNEGDTLFKTHGKITKDFEVNIHDYEQDDSEPMIRILMHIHNITEEDLK